jgi:hypothetical protein
MEKVHNHLDETAEAYKNQFLSEDIESTANDVEKSLHQVFSKDMRSLLEKAVQEVKIDNEDDKVLIIIDTLREDTRTLFKNYHDLIIEQYADNKDVKNALKEVIEKLEFIYKEIEG